MANLTGKKFGGRQKGTPNKRTKELLEIWDEINYDPARALLQLLPQLEPEDQAHVHLKLMEFKYPRRKAIEIEEKDPLDLDPSEYEKISSGDLIKLVKSNGAS